MFGGVATPLYDRAGGEASLVLWGDGLGHSPDRFVLRCYLPLAHLWLSSALTRPTGEGPGRSRADRPALSRCVLCLTCPLRESRPPGGRRAPRRRTPRSRVRPARGARDHGHAAYGQGFGDGYGRSGRREIDKIEGQFVIVEMRLAVWAGVNAGVAKGRGHFDPVRSVLGPAHLDFLQSQTMNA